MKFSLLNLLLIVVSISLAVALIVSRQDDAVARVGNYNDWWEVELNDISESKWKDKSKPPELSQFEAFRIGESICRHLNSERDKICPQGWEVGVWEVGAVSFEKLAPIGKNNWGYLVRIDSNIMDSEVYVPLTFLVLMDGTVLFGANQFEQNLVNVVMEYPGIVDGSLSLSSRRGWCEFE